MCEKCIRIAKRLGHKPLTFGQIKFFAHQATTVHNIPFFWNKGINAAIEAHIHRIERCKTNKKIYRRSKQG